MAPISQRGLQAFRTVLACGSVSGAAEIMHVSQPAVSRLIRDLEQRTGLQLFTRFGGKIVPTPQAHELAVEVERSFIGLAAIEETAREIRLGQRSTVSIAAMPALAHSILPDALAELLALRPDFRVALSAMQTHNVIRHVASRQSQLGFTAPTRQAHDIDLIRNVQMPFRCILPQGHPLADRARIGLQDLAGEKVVAFSDSTATGALMDRAFSQLRTPPLVVVRSPLSTLISQLVLRGLGLSVVDPCTARTHVQLGGVSRPFDGMVAFGFSIIKPRGASLGPDIEALLDAFDRCLAAYVTQE